MMAESSLEVERRHLRRAEELIARQEERLRRLLTIGDARTVALARGVLAGLRQSLKLSQDRIAHLERQYARQAADTRSGKG